MRTELKKMGCGGCGNETFEIYQGPEGEVITECQKCKSTTFISPSKPKLEFKWGENSSGCLAQVPGQSS
jgi:hypothetical protein